MIRYVFNHSLWVPNKPEWIRAFGVLQKEEQNRILRLAYQRDAKAAVAGRLLMRKVIRSQFGLSGKDLTISRTAYGRPYLTKPNDDLDFNVSHNGCLTVLTAVNMLKTGVDVMRIMRPPSESSISAYLQKMKPVLTSSEWDVVYESKEEEEQLRRFYRHWCLKEAYTKALGSGLGIDFSKIECRLATSEHPAPWCGSSDQKPSQWQFEEHLLGDDHVCAVAWFGDSLPEFDCLATFTELKFEDLIVGSDVINKVDSKSWSTFKEKDIQPPSLRTPVKIAEIL